MQTRFLQMKRALRTALFVLLLSAVGMGKGYAQYEEYTIGNLRYILNYHYNGTAMVVGHADGTSATGSLVIPSSVTHTLLGVTQTYTVTAIASHAFEGCTGLTGELVIPNSITAITKIVDDPYIHGAFMDCSGFTNLTLSNSLTDIPDYTFEGCTGLAGELVIPNSITSIGYSAFKDCSGLTAVYYTGSLAQWLNIAFGSNPLAYAHNLYINNELVTNLVIPENVTEIKGAVFSGATCLTSLTIPNSVTSIGAFAFSGCSGLGSLTLPNSVTTIGNSAFSGCIGFTGSLTIPNSVTTIGLGAFAGCSGFTGNLTIPNSVTTIGSQAFLDCTGFTGDLEIPNSVTSIEAGAFYGCSGMTGNLFIPNSVSFIGYACFSNGAFSAVHYNASYCTDLEDLGINYGTLFLYTYPFENCTGRLIIGEDVEKIPDYMFYFGGFTGDLCIPNSVASIGKVAFGGCSGLSSLTLPNSVTTIGVGAFAGCSGFTGDLIIPNYVTEIGNYAFYGCSGFEKCIALGETPPQVSAYDSPFDETLTHLIVPCGCKVNYEASNWANHFSAIEEDCTQHSINIDNISSNGGSVIVSTSSANIGEEVRVTVTPNAGMSLSSLTVYKTDDPSQTVPTYPIGKTSSTYGFLMPPYDVTVKAVFIVGNAIGESNGVSVSVYPNPTNGQVTIEAEGLKQITISNLLGQTIYEDRADGNWFAYDFDGQDTGVYLIRIETTKGVAVKKVSVTR